MQPFGCIIYRFLRLGGYLNRVAFRNSALDLGVAATAKADFDHRRNPFAALQYMDDGLAGVVFVDGFRRNGDYVLHFTDYARSDGFHSGLGHSLAVLELDDRLSRAIAASYRNDLRDLALELFVRDVVETQHELVPLFDICAGGHLDVNRERFQVDY